MENYFAIQLQTTNAAFTEQGLPEEELVRILNNTAERIADSIETDYSIQLKDVNGNTVGTATRLDCTKKPKPFDTKLGDFNLLIECGNAAFFDGDGEPNNHEIARIIKSIASDPDGLSKAGKEAKKLRDINGSTVGEVQWASFIAPTIDPIFTALLAEADKHLGEHLDPYDALIFKDNELISFMDDHTVFNVLHGQDSGDFSINEIEKSVGSLFSLDASELAAAILTYQASKTTKPELIDKVAQKLIDATNSESDRFALDEEEASQIQKDIINFKAAVEVGKFSSYLAGDKQPATTSNEPSM